MTQRLKFKFPWAQDGEVTDPDLDTTAPSFIANRYANLGWEVEKPPNEWQNFLSQISDLKIISLLFGGIAEFDSSVTYPVGAVSSLNGIVRVNTSTGWEEIMDLKQIDYLNDVSNLKSIYDNHLAATNPHQDTVDTITDKTYSKTTIDDAFGSPTDPRTIVYHKLQMGRVHQETPEQLGTLPTSGGTFTGPVTFLGGMLLASNKKVSMDGGTGRVEFRSGDLVLSIDALGNVVWSVGGEEYQVMTELNYSEFQIRWGNRFALPQPYLDMNMKTSINDAMSTRGWTINTTGAPVFNARGGIKVDDNTITFTGFDVSCPTSIVMYGRDAAGNLITAKSIMAPSAGYTSMATLLTNMGFTSAIWVERIICYPTLTAYQQTMLVRP
uniref:Tail fiber protein n=1 Tax=Staphylococcus phage Pel53 TaxID=3234048 RepID=A0AB39C6F7_9CAUD